MLLSSSKSRDGNLVVVVVAAAVKASELFSRDSGAKANLRLTWKNRLVAKFVFPQNLELAELEANALPLDFVNIKVAKTVKHGAAMVA